MTKATITAQDKKWQAESDARTLAEASVIKKTPGRLKLAAREAKVMAKEAMQQAVAMKKVAKVKTRK